MLMKGVVDSDGSARLSGNRADDGGGSSLRNVGQYGAVCRLYVLVQ